MKPDTPSHSFAIPLELLAKVETAAEQDHRPVGDMLRDLVERAWQSARSGRPVLQGNGNARLILASTTRQTTRS